MRRATAGAAWTICSLLTRQATDMTPAAICAWLRNSAMTIALTLMTVSAQAAPQWCYGTMSNLWLDAAGDVYVRVSWRNDYVRLCNVNGNVGSVSVTTCASWISLARSAVQRSAQTTVQYSEAPACETMPVYQAAPVPYYVMLNN